MVSHDLDVSSLDGEVLQQVTHMPAQRFDNDGCVVEAVHEATQTKGIDEGGLEVFNGDALHEASQQPAQTLDGGGRRSGSILESAQHASLGLDEGFLDGEAPRESPQTAVQCLHDGGSEGEREQRGGELRTTLDGKLSKERPGLLGILSCEGGMNGIATCLELEGWAALATICSSGMTIRRVEPAVKNMDHLRGAGRRRRKLRMHPTNASEVSTAASAADGDLGIVELQDSDRQSDMSEGTCWRLPRPPEASAAPSLEVMVEEIVHKYRFSVPQDPVAAELHFQLLREEMEGVLLCVGHGL